MDELVCPNLVIIHVQQKLYAISESAFPDLGKRLKPDNKFMFTLVFFVPKDVECGGGVANFLI